MKISRLTGGKKSSSHRGHRAHRENPYQHLVLNIDNTRGIPSPSAPPRFADQAGGFRRGLFERNARVPQPPGLSGTARAVRRTGVVGCPSLWLLSLGQTRESDLPPGNPRPDHTKRDENAGFFDVAIIYNQLILFDYFFIMSDPIHEFMKFFS